MASREHGDHGASHGELNQFTDLVPTAGGYYKHHIQTHRHTDTRIVMGFSWFSSVLVLYILYILCILYILYLVNEFFNHQTSVGKAVDRGASETYSLEPLRYVTRVLGGAWLFEPTQSVGWSIPNSPKMKFIDSTMIDRSGSSGSNGGSGGSSGSSSSRSKSSIVIIAIIN